MIFKKLAGSFGILILLLAIFLPGYTKLQDLISRNRNLKIRIKQLAVENALLQEELKRIETDPVYQEKIAREKMGVVRKGEIPVKIIQPKD